MEHNLNNDLLTRTECNALRGLAILGIVLHNYCHWLGPIVKENEYQFFQHNVDWFSQVLAAPDGLLPMHLLSYFGHYGVPIFLFLSAFGLERKYGMAVPSPKEKGSKGAFSRGVGILSFIRYHFLKLFKMMIVGFVCFTFVDQITAGRWHYTVIQVIGQLGMFNNVLPEPDRNIWPGPYWFFGLMLQLYIVYRLFLYRRHWGWTVGLMVICVVLQLFMAPEGEVLNRYRYNFMGGMLPFGFGLLFARYGERIILLRIGGLGTLMSMVFTTFLVVSMSNNFYAWAFVPVVVCLACIYFIKFFRYIKGSFMTSIYDFLVWMGRLSAALFVIHPVTRKVFIPLSRDGNMYAGLLLYIASSIFLAWVINELMKHIPNPKLEPNKIVDISEATNTSEKK
ncbi:MAG: acyltransferase [Prevotella sp.]